MYTSKSSFQCAPCLAVASACFLQSSAVTQKANALEDKVRRLELKYLAMLQNNGHQDTKWCRKNTKREKRMVRRSCESLSSTAAPPEPTATTWEPERGFLTSNASLRQGPAGFCNLFRRLVPDVSLGDRRTEECRTESLHRRSGRGLAGRVRGSRPDPIFPRHRCGTFPTALKRLLQRLLCNPSLPKSFPGSYDPDNAPVVWKCVGSSLFRGADPGGETATRWEAGQGFDFPHTAQHTR